MSSTQSEPAGARPTRPWPADRVERWPIERLIPYATNPRVHTEADIDKIAASIVEFGWTASAESGLCQEETLVGAPSACDQCAVRYMLCSR
jgi:hypothetical protein